MKAALLIVAVILIAAVFACVWISRDYGNGKGIKESEVNGAGVGWVYSLQRQPTNDGDYQQ